MMEDWSNADEGIHVSSIVTHPVGLPSSSSFSHLWTSPEIDCYLPRLVTRHPLWSSEDGIEEETIEAFVEPTVNGRFRVVIRNGPDSSANVPFVHASFLLPEPTQFPSKQENDDLGVMSLPSHMAWTYFEQGNNQKCKELEGQQKSTYLCVLVHPNLLSIHRVYPQKSSNAEWTVQQEGWTVPLPLECSSIFAIPRTGGLLLQRLPDATDIEQVLLEPPPTVHHHPREGLAMTSLTLDSHLGVSATAVPNNSLPSVPALFTLRHYQQDLTPLALNHQGCFWDDPLEQVLWVGESFSYEPKSDHDKTILIVTHHTQWKRHAIWSLDKAPPPPKPPTLPMYYAARHNYHGTVQGNYNAMTTLLHPLLLWDSADDEDPEDVVFKGNRSFAPSDYSRQEALADALGVPNSRSHHHQLNISKTPRQSISTSLPGTSARGASGFFSPNPTSNYQHRSESFLDPGAESVWQHNATTTNFFSTIHSYHLTKSLYQEPNNSSLLPSSKVFLVSDADASALNILALLIEDDLDNFSGLPRRGPRAAPLRRNPQKSLRLFQLVTEFSSEIGTPSLQLKNDVASTTIKRIQPVGNNPNDRADPNNNIICLDAQPIQATPLLRPARKCALGTKPTMEATDILVLSCDETLTLYRAQTPLTIVTLALSSSSSSQTKRVTVSSLRDPVGHRVGLVPSSPSSNLGTRKGGEVEKIHSCCRVSVKLALPLPWVEQAVCAIQARLEEQEQGQRHHGWSDSYAALLFRVDVVRVFQRLAKNAPPTLAMNLPYKALKAVVLAGLKWDLGLAEQDPPKFQNKTTMSSSWQALQMCEYSLDHDLFHFGPLASDETEESWLQTTYLQSRPQFLRYIEHRNRRGSLTPRLFDPLHLLLEDSKLSNSGSPPDLVALLIRICELVPQSHVQQAFLRHYQFSSLAAAKLLVSETAQTIPKNSFPFTQFVVPPSVLAWVEDIFSRRPSSSYFESLSPQDVNPTCFRTRFVRQALQLLRQTWRGSSSGLVELLVNEGFRDPLSISEVFVPGIAFPLLSLLSQLTSEVSEKTLSGLSPESFALIGRNDLSLNMIEVTASSIFLPPAPAPPSRPAEVESAENSSLGGAFSDEDKDGLVPLEVTCSMLFPDNRIHEAARLLRSSRPIFLRVPRVVEITDHEYEQLKQRKLAVLVRRALALPVGRGMMTIGTLKPLAAESLPLPELCLKGRVAPTNATISLDQTESPPELKAWPDFHNGVAAGLRLPLQGSEDFDSQVTRTWILYNKPLRSETPTAEDGANHANTHQLNNAKNHAHGGFLLALGLRGHLIALEMTDIYEYLTQGTVTLTVGVLLGMAANKRGSCDMSVSKMLCLHIPSLIPQHFSAIDVASAVQSAAVTGVGLLYQRSSHRMMTEFLLNEIGKRPDSDTSAFDREAYTLSCGIALGMVNLCIGEKSGCVDKAAGISDLRVEERLRRYINGGQSNEEEARRIQESNDRFSIPASSNGVDNEKCSIIYETNMVNTDVTAPAATLALGLMYMKSENHTVASAVSIPKTHFLLEFVRPDFLVLRVVARSLILWDEVEPSQSWIEGQVPEVVQSAYLSMRSIARRAMEGRTPVKSQRAVDYDRRAVRQIYVNIIAGACFSIGLRFAGTGDERAKKALFDCVLQMHKLREGNDPVSVVSKPEFPILETCLGLMSISLAMVLAGTGDLDALRLFKVIRWREKDVVYGSHMVLGSAIGLLFLGGGTMTLGRSPEDIAALITAFFPRFPTESMDNQYHLQALRHFYALATKKSDIWAVDADTGERVYVPVETLVEGNANLQTMQVPCLLRNTDVPLRSLQVVSDEFYPVLVNLRPGTNVFYVKRRRSPEANLGNLCAPKGEFDLLSQLEYLSLSPTDEPFVKKLISEGHAKDRYGIVLLFLSLMNGLRSIDHTSTIPVELMWDLRLMRAYTESDVYWSETQVPLEAEVLACLLEKSYQQLFLFSPRMPDRERKLLVSVLYGSK